MRRTTQIRTFIHRPIDESPPKQKAGWSVTSAPLPKRLIVIASVLATALLGSACSSSSTPPAPSPTTTPTPTPSSMTTKEASKFFLTAVCPLDTSIHVVGNLALAAGGWPQVDPKVSKNYIADAAGVARSAAAALSDPQVNWPAAMKSAVKGTSRDILALIVPLQEMSQASTGADMAKPWSAISNQPRADEQDLRLQLELPAAGATHDGCPAAPPVIPAKPSPSQTSKPSSNQSGGGLASGHTHSNSWPSYNYYGPSAYNVCYVPNYPLSYPLSYGSVPGAGSAEYFTLLSAQAALRAMNYGFPPIVADAQFGPQTARAVSVFQQNHKVPVTGAIDASTWSAINSAVHYWAGTC